MTTRTTQATHGVGRVVIINDLAEMKGGATGIAMQATRLLRDKGIPTLFVTGASKADPSLGEAITLASSHILDKPRPRAALDGIFNAKSWRTLVRWISENDTPSTLYHVHGWSKSLSPSVFLALRPVARRVVVHAHDFFLTCPNGGYFDFQRSSPCTLPPLSRACLQRQCDRRGYSHKLWRSARLQALRHLIDLRDIGRILVVHDEMVSLFRQQGYAHPNVQVLRNPVDPWSGVRTPAELNRTFLYVGRLDEDKGVHLLVQAARRARVPLHLVGAGPLAEWLTKDFPEVRMSGWCSREELAIHCRQARALIVPSNTRETFGLAALEALTSGLPLGISSAALLAGEIVANECGLSFEPTDTTDFIGTLERLSSDDGLVRTMSHNGVVRGRALAPTPGDWIDHLVEHYRDVIAIAGPRPDLARFRLPHQPASLAPVQDL
ncbi:MAG: glycosyltransferase family 4 protein [Hyphomicrobiaceae bacterium]